MVLLLRPLPWTVDLLQPAITFVTRYQIILLSVRSTTV